jgi:hypothetical protein
MSFSSDRFQGREGVDGPDARRMGIANRAANKSHSLPVLQCRERRRPNETVPSASGPASHVCSFSHVNEYSEIVAVV